MNQKTVFGIIIIVLIAAGVFMYRGFANDSTVPNENTTDQNPPNSAENAPPGSIHNLPVPPGVAAVRTFVTNEEKVAEGEVLIMSAHEKDWSDSCLGLGGPAESCAAVITPGWEVVVQVKGETRTFRSSTDGTIVREDK